MFKRYSHETDSKVANPPPKVRPSSTWSEEGEENPFKAYSESPKKRNFSSFVSPAVCREDAADLSILLQEERILQELQQRVIKGLLVGDTCEEWAAITTSARHGDLSVSLKLAKSRVCRTILLAKKIAYL